MIAFLSDFGPGSHYVGQVKAVLSGVTVIDLCHDIPPGDVRAGAYVLHTSWDAFPDGTIFLAVVDPGVGTNRVALAATWEKRFFVAPDNGLLSPFMDEDFRAVALDTPESASATFHARDIFAPAALALERGAALEDLGRAHATTTHCAMFAPRETADGIRARIIMRDRFGNLVTDVPAGMLAGRQWSVLAGGSVIEPAGTYGDVQRGQALALIGSGGFLEISVREDDAGKVLGIGPGDVVEVTWKKS